MNARVTVEFKLLGTGAGPGVPSYFCDCSACQEAKKNPLLARTRSGAIIETAKEKILIDASPDLRSQLVKEQIKSIDYVFLTHWHYDHFGGLGDREFYVKLCRRQTIKLFLPPEALNDFQSAFPFLLEVFDIVTWQFEQVYYFNNLILKVLPAQHGIQTAGILMESERTVAYFTDTAGLSDNTAGKITGVDYLICDATFYGENWYPNSHMSINEAIILGNSVKAKQTILTHLAMHYSTPVTVAQLEKEISVFQDVSLAYDGMIINLGI